MKHPAIAIVVAMAENRVIGRDGGLPWRLPADLARFRALTMGKPIIMGRRTHESIGRVLDGRRNIVVTRHPDYQAPGCIVATSLEAAFEAASSAEEISVIGGAGIYEQALPFASRMHLTLVHASIDGDVRFPDIEPGEWQEISRVERSTDARNPYDLSFIELTRHCTGVASVRMRACSSSTAPTPSKMNSPASTVSPPRPSLNSNACSTPSPLASLAPWKGSDCCSATLKPSVQSRANL